MAEPAKKDADAGEKRRNPPRIVLPGGVTRYNASRSLWCVRRKLLKLKAKGIEIPEPKPEFIIKPIGGEKNGGTRKVYLKKEKRLYATEGRRKNKRLCSKKRCMKYQKQQLRSTITPGTILIMVAGKHRGKRVVFLKQLDTGLLLVTGPYKLNGCPLRRVNQIYVMATSTKLDISNVKIPEHLDDAYFKRQRPPKKSKKDDEEIFETKKQGYVLTEQRKKDQVELDRQIISVIHKHPEKKTMLQYFRAMFYLRNHMYPHQMKF